MEGGGKREEAGPSSASGVLKDDPKGQLEINDKAENLAVVSSDDEEEQHQNHDEDDDADGGKIANFVPGPLISLKDQIEKDQEDESLRKWKEKLLGCLESDLNGRVEPEVKFHSIGILSSDFGEINTPLPVSGDQSKPVLFTLKEGSEYRLKLTFSVLHNIVSGLAYTNTVWKGGVEVDQKNGMLGTFAPQREPYIHALEEETTPSGVLARGNYTAKLRFEDDDRRCHMELDYVFEIRKSR